jgi:hypothetical protein
VPSGRPSNFERNEPNVSCKNGEAMPSIWGTLEPYPLLKEWGWLKQAWRLSEILKRKRENRYWDVDQTPPTQVQENKKTWIEIKVRKAKPKKPNHSCDNSNYKTSG